MVCQKCGYSKLVATKYYCHISDIKHGNFTKKQIFHIFIKAVMFHYVGLTWMIEMEEKFYFAVDEHDEEWCTGVS